MVVQLERIPEQARRIDIPSVTLPGGIRIDNQVFARYCERHGILTGSGQTLNPESLEKAIGINTRYRLQPLDETPKPISETVPEIAVKCTEELVKNFKVEPSSIDYTFVFTSYPFGQKIADEVTRSLEINSPAIDTYAACTGAAYLLYKIHQKLGSQKANILLVAAEHYSAKMDPKDLNGSIFSDGATAFLLRLGQDFEICDQAFFQFERSDAIKMPIDYRLTPLGSIVLSDIPNDTAVFSMDGPRVFKWFIGGAPLENVMTLRNQLVENVETRNIHIVPHQGSGRIVIAIAEGLEKRGIYDPVSSRTVRKFGNLAAGSMLAELGALLQDPDSNVRKDDVIILAGFGAGLATAVVGLRALRDFKRY